MSLHCTAFFLPNKHFINLYYYYSEIYTHIKTVLTIGYVEQADLRLPCGPSCDSWHSNPWLDARVQNAVLLRPCGAGMNYLGHPGSAKGNF